MVMRLRSFAPRVVTALLGSAAALAPIHAHATGMQGHMYMAECAAEQSSDPRLRALFEEHFLSLQNGAFFPDSGYTADDHDQGEIAHWEQYVQGYIELIRERYPAPLESDEGAKHVAFLMGLAAHGITDSTFDPLLMDRSEQVDPGDINELDMTMDIFLVAKLPRSYVPTLSFDAQTLSDVYQQKIPHQVTAASVEKAMKTARSGIAAVTTLLSTSAGVYEQRHPWAAGAFLDGRVPGGYPFGAQVAARYYEELLRRLDGDVSADAVVIGTYPSASMPLVTLDASRADGRVVLFFGHGLDRESLDLENNLALFDASGERVPAEVATFRGDRWVNVLTLRPKDAWAPSSTYKLVLKNAIRTLNGASPSKDFELLIPTCTPDASGDCAPLTGSPPASRCPKTDARYLPAPDDDGDGEVEEPSGEVAGAGGATAPDAQVAADASDEGGCSTSGPASRGWGVIGAALLAAALASLTARRRSS